MKPAKFLTVRETARQLGCTLKYVYDQVYSGRLPGSKAGKQWQIPAQSVQARLKEREVRNGTASR
jgi:excisionase family DNA binding protein